MEARENPGLKANVISMYKSRFQREGFFRPKIVEDWKIPGKLKKQHSVDIYFEFIQMNNLERTIIKTIEGTEVTEEDVWEFACVLNDLRFFAKGILYYDDKVSIGAKKAAEMANIDLKKFNFLNEVQKSVISALKMMLPEDDIVGDPFWVVMETIKNNNDENTGNYDMVNDKILLFLSKKQADSYCEKLEESSRVFGISQNHLKILVRLQENGICPDFNIVLPKFEQPEKDSIACYSISHEKFRKFYLRGDGNE
ncbi:hypothetical protein [Jeotgalibaca ciconiae]|uniref:Uncharacterized protein n=1 Tax=Jeotgalibaca ciconiae TaxID=2496265 RepID=A0A3S9H8Q5_9LACT|nr:hypothetical protein [Jeotgalibaca ciconiae]AZP03732.1 hypothetical protein EJN90_03075 [Jeotgalibaca ciconiae]